MEEFNDKKLFEIHNHFNPVAKILSITYKGKGKINHFDEQRGL